jgi:hypothetical protein
MRLLVMLTVLAASALLAQKDKMPPEIAPKDFTFRDVLSIDPAHYRKEMENDQIRVLRLNLKGDESVPVHEAPDGLFVCLRECHLRLTDPRGYVQDVHLEDGHTRWIGGGTRSERNLSTHSVEMLFIETRSRR